MRIISIPNHQYYITMYISVLLLCNFSLLGQCKVTRMKLVGLESGYLLFIIDSHTLCTMEIINNVCVPCSWIPLPFETQKEGDVSDYQLSSDAVVVLDRNAQLLCILF